jgi:hypothetical protein
VSGEREVKAAQCLSLACLSPKAGVNWTSAENFPVNGRSSFYYNKICIMCN